MYNYSKMLKTERTQYPTAQKMKPAAPGLTLFFSKIIPAQATSPLLKFGR